MPEKGWTDGLALSPRFDGSMNTRHTPTMYGVAFYPDPTGMAGRRDSRRRSWRRGVVKWAAIPTPWRRTEAVPRHVEAFQKEYEGPPTGDRIVKALASYVRTIHAGNTPWDRAPQDSAEAAKTAIGRGFQVFSTSGCVVCHTPPLFSDSQFHNVGIGSDKPTPDMGRGKILADAAAKSNQPVTPDMERLMGAFKNSEPPRRSAKRPYFHDRSVRTLDEAVDLMLKGGVDNKTRDVLLKPQTLTPAQRKDLMAFLAALTPDNSPYPRPKPW